LPEALANAVGEVAELLELDRTWLNGGPGSLMKFGLPAGFFERCHTRNLGGIVLHLASRYDQIHFKLYAAADDVPNGKHHVDLKKLEPTHEELNEAARWATTHDPSEGFAIMLTGVLRSFGI
jgi:hypothetical protein